MGYNYGYNGNTDFKSWYKQNYDQDWQDGNELTKAEGMSDDEFGVGKELYDGYLKTLQDEGFRTSEKESINTSVDKNIEGAKAGFQSAREELTDSRNRSEEHASIAYQRLQKYLPMQAQAQGLGGLGAKASVGLEAYNDYMGRLGGIESDYNANMREINTDETSELSGLEQYRATELGKVDTKYNDLARRNADKTEQDVKQLLEGYLTRDRNAANLYASGTDSRDMTAFEQDFRAKYGHIFSDSELDAYLTLARGQIDDNIKADDEKQKNAVLEYLDASSSTDASELQKYVQTMYPEGSEDPNYNTLMAYAQTRANDNKAGEIENLSNLSVTSDMVTEEIDRMMANGASSAEIESYYAENADKMTAADKSKYKDIVETNAKVDELLSKTVTAGVTFNEDGSKLKDKEGDNFSLTYTDPSGDKHIWRVENGGKVTDEDVLLISTKIPEKEVFAYNSKFYIRVGENVYLIDERNASHYTMMAKVLAGSYQPKESGKGWEANGTLR